MTPEIFNARVVQIQLERDAINAEIAGMKSRNVWRECNGGGEPDFGIFDFKVSADKLRSLQGDIKALMDEYQAAGKPAPSPAEWESKARRVMAGMLLFIEHNVDHDLGLNTGGTVYSKSTIREDVIALLGLKEDDDKLMLDCNGEGTGK